MTDVGLGTLHLPLTKRHYFVVTGGPFYDCPDTYIGVKMAAEIHRPCVVNIPTRDFQTPHPHDLRRGLRDAVTHLLAGEPLYVGCMGGKGRTGLFLAVLAKALGVKNPVEYVRRHYYSHAVETADQYRFVQEFEIPADVQRVIRRARLKAQWYLWSKSFWQRKLTRVPGKLLKSSVPRVASALDK